MGDGADGRLLRLRAGAEDGGAGALDGIGQQPRGVAVDQIFVLVEYGYLVSVDEGSAGIEGFVVQADDVIRLVSIGGDRHAGASPGEGLHDFDGLRAGAAGEGERGLRVPD